MLQSDLGETCTSLMMTSRRMALLVRRLSIIFFSRFSMKSKLCPLQSYSRGQHWIGCFTSRRPCYREEGDHLIFHLPQMLTLTKGDLMQINVVNLLTDFTMLTGTSIVRQHLTSLLLYNPNVALFFKHWHGLFQKGSSWADGPTGVNQCPITPNNSFLYQFDIGDQAGTYWYHSHLGARFLIDRVFAADTHRTGTQYCDGLRGALVIYDPEDPFRHL